MITPYGVSVGTAPTLLAMIPSGPVSLSITNTGASSLFVASGTTASTAGAPVPAAGVVNLVQGPSSSATRLWGVSGAGALPIGVVISTGT